MQHLKNNIKKLTLFDILEASQKLHLQERAPFPIPH